MLMSGINASFRDVSLYASDVLKNLADGVEISATYKKEWDDGFGARGWKLNATIGDPDIIASTRQAGDKIKTSVFVHDILDHFISGFGVSGHRSEAMASFQLAERTGSDIRPDLLQMINEDILNGRVNGETLCSFLPEEMLCLLPSDVELTDKEVVAVLTKVMGRDVFVDALVDHFYKLGREGINHAVNSWKKLGLDLDDASDIGLALQRLLDQVDYEAEISEIESLNVSIEINNKECIFRIETDDSRFTETEIHETITV